MLDGIFNAFKWLGNLVWSAIEFIGSLLGKLGTALSNGMTAIATGIWNAFVEFVLYIFNDYLLPLWTKYEAMIDQWISKLVSNETLPSIGSSVAFLDSVVDIQTVLAAISASITILIFIPSVKFLIKLIPTIG